MKRIDTKRVAENAASVAVFKNEKRLRVFLAISEEGGWVKPFDIMNKTKIPQGAVYHAFGVLAEKGFLCFNIDPAEGKLYKLSDLGWEMIILLDNLDIDLKPYKTRNCFKCKVEV